MKKNILLKLMSFFNLQLLVSKNINYKIIVNLRYTPFCLLCNQLEKTKREIILQKSQ